MHHPEKREAVFAPSARVSLSLLCFTRSASWLDLVKASSGQFSELKKMEMAVRSARPKNGMSSRFSGSTPRFEPPECSRVDCMPAEVTWRDFVL